MNDTAWGYFPSFPTKSRITEALRNKAAGDL
jgi:hypothetical protein